MSSTDAIERIMSCTEIDQQDNVCRQLLDVITERLWEDIAEIAESKRRGGNKVKLFSLQMDSDYLVFTFRDGVNRLKTVSLDIQPR